MYRNKKDVDKHVDSLLSKLSVKEFKTRAYSIARLYFEVGDYASCKQYVEQYLTQKDNNAAAYKLLGQALQKLGQKEKALEQYKTSLDIDPTQTSTILDICELLAEDEIAIDSGRAKYWCEKAEMIFPRHPITFKLRERLITVSNSDPEALVKLLTAELAVRPKDVSLHTRLLNHYMRINQFKEALEHASNVEFGRNNFLNNYAWYETLIELVKHNSHNIDNWLYQLIFLTVRERICILSLTETPSGSSKSLVESNDLLHAYDQAIETVSKAGAAPGFAEFHANLLQHHRGQLAFHAATYLLKKSKKDQLSWRDSTKFTAPLMLIAWHTVPLDPKVNWLAHAPEKQQQAVHRWYSEGAYRCSQSGYYLLSNVKDKTQSILDKISQCCSGTHWRDKLYEKLFSGRGHLSKIKSSYLVSSGFSDPVLRLPRRAEVETYDIHAQKEFANSLHHFVWTLLNYKNFSHFKCSLFEMLKPSASTGGPETLNKMDIYAFLYCATLTARQQKPIDHSVPSDKPLVLPAHITDLLCPLSQMKWWDCAYKFAQNELGMELTDIRATLSRGIEVVRCIDNHGLDPELLCILGRIFSDKAKLITAVDEKTNFENRAALYYTSAIPLLEKLKSKIIVKLPEKRMFDYMHKEITTKELLSLLEESKLFVAVNYLNECEYDKVIEVLTNLKSPQAYFYLSQTYKKIALEENNNESRDNVEAKSKCVSLLTKARNYAYKTLDCLRHTETPKDNPLYSDSRVLIEDIEIQINKIDPELSGNTVNDVEGKDSSDENMSLMGSEYIPNRSHIFRNLSSTPKQSTHQNITNYRTAVDSHILENTRVDQQFLERIENEIKNLQKRDATINDFMDQTKTWFEENRKLGNQIISTINSNIQSTTDQFKLLKISVDQVKDQIDECRNECKDVGDLKKQIAELKKEVNKLKKSPSEQNINENDLYNMDEEYRTNESSSNFSHQMAFAPSQVMPPFNQRIVPPFPMPPNPYQLYGQNLYNLYNQYSQLAQAAHVPGAPPMFDPTRAHNFPGVYPTPDQMYLEVTQLVPPTVPAPAVSAVPPVPTVPTIPPVPPVPTVPISVPPPAPIPSVSVRPSKPAVPESKEISGSLPANVVITSSDPLPTCTTVPAPVLSVTIPQKHIKGTVHNYQIPMPSTNDNKVMTPPIFSFPSSGNKSTVSPFTGWNQSNIFKNTQVPTINTQVGIINDTGLNLCQGAGDGSMLEKSVVDGSFSEATLNTSLNKSRTISERSNTSVENYDPCPDFKPIIPLPAEVKITTGEEDEIVIFSSRAKLFRFVDKQWKERGLGEMKLLKHKTTGKVRVLMRREQIHKICANHIISPEMEIKPMKNETKAYFWFANDFADENVILEKFCIRFKTADIAKQFYDAFENARKECITSSAYSPKSENKYDSTKPVINQFSGLVKTTISSSTPQQPKAVVGGFTFSSTPTFKPVEEEKVPVSKSEPVTTKINVFSGLSFKTTTTSPFSNIFTTTGNQEVTDTSDNTMINNDANDEINNSDAVEDFEPNVDFKPVIPLPALVEQKTGEEDENILFEYRAKLLRFDTSSKEWKERGLGNIKLLVHKDNIQKARLLMRREQIMKVCCNHALTKEMVFQKMPNMDKAVTWGAKDFSEGELVSETFCLRFKTAQICDEFIEAVKIAQSKMKDDSKAAKEEQNAAKQNNVAWGFGDKFKPKSGSWYCDTCYTNNLDDYQKCACCEQPKPIQGDEVSTSNKNSSPVVSSSWGEAFKPKPGTWECKQCLIRNDADVQCCNACNSPKDDMAPKCSTKLPSENTTKFTFGIPHTDSPAQSKGESQVCTTVFGWGDKFKLKEGTWECNHCLVRNESKMECCSACNNPKDPNASKSVLKSIFEGNTTETKFKFGITDNTLSDQKSAASTQNTSIFDGTGAHKFSFGIPSTTQDKGGVISFGDSKPLPSIFGVSKKTETEQPINFSVKKNDELSNDSVISIKPALLPTPKIDATPTSLSNEGGTFGFVFKPKTPPKGKSPVKSAKSPGEDSDGNEYASDDEGHHIHFSPVIPMPDKVEVVTGEENETKLYGHRAKLFRFIGGEWKERGIGIVKILKHNDTKKLRVVMRREQVLKICLNHALTSDIIYTPKDERSWLFAANDFSEGELSLQQFCLRFKTKEIALEFKDAVDKSRDCKSSTEVLKETESKTETESKENNNNDDVVFIEEIQATTEEKEKAKELMLPENFFTYKNKEPCTGCRGCCDEDEPKTGSKSTDTQSTKPPVITSVSTPAKMSVITTVSTPTTFTFFSPATSLYGTPTPFENPADNSMFRTPLGAIGSNIKPATVVMNNNNVAATDTTNKENANTQKSNIFSGLGEQKSLFSTPQVKTNLFSSGESLTPTSTKTSILAAPKLNTLNISADEKKGTESKSIFGSVLTNPVFPAKNIFDSKEGSDNTSTFGFSSEDKKEDNEKTEVKSIFGSDQKSVNLFSNSNQGGIFGPAALTSNQTKLGNFGSSGTSVFAANTTQTQAFGTGRSIFGSGTNTSQWTIGANTDQKKPHVPGSNDSEVTESPLKVDNTLSFAALSSSEPGFKKQENFQWEGAGQQLFVASSKAGGDRNQSKNDSAGDDNTAATVADDEYDPHYEPIVPLPDKIVVTTGEEDEEKLFGERCKLFRYDEKSREWKERGVGEIKVLYHPEKKSYRLLLRREQVHKAVLNMLLFMDLELLPMKNSDRAWTWAGRNYAETPAGEQEMLAVRFKSNDLATAFHDKVVECVRKLQAAKAQAIREEKENNQKQFQSVAPLRLPKHLADSARADNVMSAKAAEHTQMASKSDNQSQIENKANGEMSKPVAEFKQVHFQMPQEERHDDEDDDDDDEDYEHDYDHNEDYDSYYNEDEEESAAYYSCDAEVTVRQGDTETVCDHGHIQVLYDQDIYSPKILVTDSATGEILAEMLIHTDTEFQMNGDTCIWSGTDYTSNDPVYKTVTVNFHDSETAMLFYDSCETSKAATYSSTDPDT